MCKPKIDMKATVNVLCYRSKTLKNGEHPLVICVCKERKRKYIGLGVSINPIYWDFKKNRPKRNCPNRDQINNLIREQEQKYSEQVFDFSAKGKEFTLTTLVETVETSSKQKTVGALFLEYIEQLKCENRMGYALSVRQVYTSLLKYKGHLDFYFSDIDMAWLKDYEGWLHKLRLSENTIGIRFRTLRVLYNMAITEGLVKAEHYPFKKFKVSKLHKETAKRAITKDQIKQIMSVDTSSFRFYKKLAVDMFVFSYLMGGINFTDMSMLTYDNIEGDRLVYVRQKTNKTIILPMLDEAFSIVRKYRDGKRKYVFPVLDDRKRTAMQLRYRILDVLANVNGHLESIGRSLGIELKLTTYVARHSYATVLKRSGVSTSIISESLGHSSERVTQIYLDSFDNEQINDAMKNLL